MENFTTASQELINNSAQIANKHHNTTLKPLHLLAATLKNEFYLTFFNRADVPTHELGLLIKRELALVPTSSSNEQLALIAQPRNSYKHLKKKHNPLVMNISALNIFFYP